LKIGIEQSHAHSQYLDQLAKFGIVGLSFFFATIINVGKVLFTINCDKSKTGLLGVMLFVFLLHMTFDVTTTYFITLIPMIFYSVKLLDKENAKPTVYSEYFG
jgi:O-antigen ligase